jgi:hypothetical protein
MLLFFMIFLWCFCSCFHACQSPNSCDSLLLPATSCLFNNEFGGCRHRCAKICPFDVACLVVYYASIMNPRFTPRYPNECAHQPIWNVLWKMFHVFFIPIVIQVASNWAFACPLTTCLSLCCNHHLYCFSSFIFFPLLSFCYTILFCRCFVNCLFFW